MQAWLLGRAVDKPPAWVAMRFPAPAARVWHPCARVWGHSTRGCRRSAVEGGIGAGLPLGCFSHWRHDYVLPQQQPGGFSGWTTTNLAQLSALHVVFFHFHAWGSTSRQGRRGAFSVPPLPPFPHHMFVPLPGHPVETRLRATDSAGRHQRIPPPASPPPCLPASPSRYGIPYGHGTTTVDPAWPGSWLG